MTSGYAFRGIPPKLSINVQCGDKLGAIKYYDTSEKMVFECPHHKRCFLTRMVRRAVRGLGNKKAYGQGRPYVNGLCWLTQVDLSVHTTRESHVADFIRSNEMRVKLRNEVRLSPAGSLDKAFLDAEAPVREGDPEEPEVV